MLGCDRAISSGSWTIDFYPLSNFNRFTSYSFLATFSSLISFPCSSALLPAVWRPDVPASPFEVAQFQNDCLDLLLVLAELAYIGTCTNTGFHWSFFWRLHCSPLSGCLFRGFLVLILKMQSISFIYVAGTITWGAVLHPQASNDSKHELLPGREEGCSENNSFPPKVWTSDVVAGWNEIAANQLLPFPLLTSRHCIPISHRRAIYNPHLQALLLKFQQHETLSQANREWGCLGQTSPGPFLRAGRQRCWSWGCFCLGDDTSPPCCDAPGDKQGHLGRGQVWVRPWHLLCHCRNCVLSQEWLIGSSQEEPSSQQCVLLPSSINTLLLLPLQWTNTPPFSSPTKHLFTALTKHTSI